MMTESNEEVDFDETRKAEMRLTDFSAIHLPAVKNLVF